MSLRLTHPVSACKLWIDGVGCWMMCLTNRVTLGNPLPIAETAKISIIADLGTEQAHIEFEDANFWITANKEVFLDGDQIQNRQGLCHGTRVTLGRDVELRFGQPSPLSLTSSLELESGHRFDAGVDGIILFQKTCLLGAGNQKHIDCGDWAGDVILFERENQLYCKSTQEMITLDGVPGDNVVKVHDGAHLAGKDWSMRIEAL